MKVDLLKIIKHYGINSQQRKLEEEVFELQEAITKAEYNRYIGVVREPCDECINHITEEISDVLVLLGQIIHYYDIEVSDIEKNMEYKIMRQLRRIKNKNYNYIEKITVSKEDNLKKENK